MLKPEDYYMSNESLLGDDMSTTETTTEAATTEATTEAVQDTQATETTQEEVTTEQVMETSTEQPEVVQEEQPLIEADLTRLVEGEVLEQSNLKDFKSVNDLAKSYVNLQKMMGSSIRIPDEDSSPEAKESFLKKIAEVEGVMLEPTTPEQKMEMMNKLGRPESIEGYTTDDIIPSELLTEDSTQEELDLFRKQAHELGLTKEQAQGLMKMRMDQVAEYHNAMAASRESGLKHLHEIWGNDFDTNLAAAQSMKEHLKESFPEQMQELLSVAGNNAALAHIMSEVAKSYQEKLSVSNTRSSFGMSSTQAAEKINKLFKDSKFTEALNNPVHPGHDRAVAEFERLAAIRSGHIG